MPRLPAFKNANARKFGNDVLPPSGESESDWSLLPFTGHTIGTERAKRNELLQSPPMESPRSVAWFGESTTTRDKKKL